MREFVRDDFRGSLSVLEAGVFRIEEQDRIAKENGPSVFHGSECKRWESHEIELRVGMARIEPSFEAIQAFGGAFESKIGEVSFSRKSPYAYACRSGSLDGRRFERADCDGDEIG